MAIISERRIEGLKTNYESLSAINIYEPSDISPGGRRVHTTNGMGVIPLADPSSDLYHPGNITNRRCEIPTGERAFWVFRYWPSKRNSYAPYFNYDIGGDENSIWWTGVDSGNNYIGAELAPSDFSVVQETTYFYGKRGVGGTSNTIWYCGYLEEIGQLATSDLSVVETKSSPGTHPQSVGGDGSTIWHTDTDEEKIYELATDYSVVKSDSSVGGYDSFWQSKVGGDGNIIWATNLYEVGVLYELDTDFTTKRSAQREGVMGMGGNVNVLWHSNTLAEEVHELKIDILGDVG